MLCKPSAGNGGHKMSRYPWFTVYRTKIWDGTYNADGTKHRKNLSSDKSSADLERQVNALKNQVAQAAYVPGLCPPVAEGV